MKLTFSRSSATAAAISAASARVFCALMLNGESPNGAWLSAILGAAIALPMLGLVRFAHASGRGKVIAPVFALLLAVDVASVVDLTARLKTKTTYADICYAVRHASETNMKGIIDYTSDMVVSADLIGTACPCVFDEKAGIMLDNDFVKLIAWYDNEWGYSNMVVRLLEHMVAVDNDEIKPEKRKKIPAKSLPGSFQQKC